MALVTPDGTCCLCTQPRSHGHQVWSTAVHSHATGQVHVGDGRALGTGNLGPNVVLLGLPRSWKRDMWVRTPVASLSYQ